MKMRFFCEAVVALMFSTAIASAQQAPDTVAPEKATGLATAKRVESKNFMVAAANPLATKAGRDVIAAGGNVYYLAKLAGIFGLNVQDIGAQQTGMSVDAFKAKLEAAGR